MDALPVTEKTGLPYASKVQTRDNEGKEVGVMHACGHDMHMTCWVGTARVLAALKDHWQGTLVFIGQPAEEIGAGARAMLDDGLFKKFPKPDYCLALHCDPRIAARPRRLHRGPGAGQRRYRRHHRAAARAATARRRTRPSIRSCWPPASSSTCRPSSAARRNPLDPAVVTVGSIHGGTKHNIIPNEVKLQLTVRTTKDTVRKHVLEAIDRIAKAAAMAAPAPEPDVTVSAGEFTPALFNDSALTRQDGGPVPRSAGRRQGPRTAADDGRRGFQPLRRPGARVPIFLYFLGTMPPERVAEAAKGGRPLPSLHSDQYYPIPEPTHPHRRADA